MHCLEAQLILPPPPPLLTTMQFAYIIRFEKLAIHALTLNAIVLVVHDVVVPMLCLIL